MITACVVFSSRFRTEIPLHCRQEGLPINQLCFGFTLDTEPPFQLQMRDDDSANVCLASTFPAEFCKAQVTFVLGLQEELLHLIVSCSWLL